MRAIVVSTRGMSPGVSTTSSETVGAVFGLLVGITSTHELLLGFRLPI